MIIYHSTQVRPYVYFGVSRTTGEIYAGYREANKLPSDIDLFIYRTSSKIVHPRFDEFDWCIVAEFFTGYDAYDFEQQLIYENWGNPLLLNRNYRLPNGEKRFKLSPGQSKGRVAWNKGIPMSEERLLRHAKSMIGVGLGVAKGPSKLIGVSRPEKVKQSISVATKGKNKGKKRTAEQRAIRSARMKNSTNPMKCPETIAKHLASCRSRIVNKSPCPHCGEVVGVTKSGKYGRWHGDNCKSKS